MPLICNNCGHENPEDAKYCENCGAHFTKIIYPEEDRRKDNEEVYEDDIIFAMLNNLI